jgi:hypothetical protein
MDHSRIVHSVIDDLPLALKYRHRLFEGIADGNSRSIHQGGTKAVSVNQPEAKSQVAECQGRGAKPLAWVQAFARAQPDTTLVLAILRTHGTPS